MRDRDPSTAGIAFEPNSSFTRCGFISAEPADGGGGEPRESSQKAMEQPREKIFFKLLRSPAVGLMRSNIEHRHPAAWPAWQGLELRPDQLFQSRLCRLVRSGHPFPGGHLLHHVAFRTCGSLCRWTRSPSHHKIASRFLPEKHGRPMNAPAVCHGLSKSALSRCLPIGIWRLDLLLPR